LFNCSPVRLIGVCVNINHVFELISLNIFTRRCFPIPKLLKLFDEISLNKLPLEKIPLNTFFSQDRCNCGFGLWSEFIGLLDYKHFEARKSNFTSSPSSKRHKFDCITIQNKFSAFVFQFILTWCIRVGCRAYCRQLTFIQKLVNQLTLLMY